MKTTLAILFSLLCGAMAAQSTLGLQYGYHHLQRQDLTFSPLTFSGAAPLNLGLVYGKTGANSFFAAGLHVTGFQARSTDAFEYTSRGDAKPKTVPASSFWQIDLNFQYLRRLKIKDEQLAIFAGLALDNQVAALFYEFGEYGAFGYTTVASLAPAVAVNWQLSEKNMLNFTANLPVLSWVARSPYAINDDDFIERQSSHRGLETLLRLSADGELASFGNLQRLAFAAQFQRKLSERWTANLGYDFALLRSQKPHHLTAIENGVSLGIACRF
ncbi:MAG: hypothetical protein IPN76_21515 [Saprospiraceae bacterium]|nr:hypothetical protein [Saprospiraceae bacterium]